MWLKLTAVGLRIIKCAELFIAGNSLGTTCTVYIIYYWLVINFVQANHNVKVT